MIRRAVFYLRSGIEGGVMKIRSIFASLVVGINFIPGVITAETLTPPSDPTQSINYWKPHIIEPARDPEVEKAHQVFARLLRTWDGSRIEPSLYVVRSDAGPWAASLLDGNILLSYQAIKICNHFGRSQSQDLLAFVLAHELAHQRRNDLWHQKFFRLAGSLAPGVRRQLLQGVEDSRTFKTLERREAQADHDGLTMMSVVGYDPFRIVDKKDFFTQWVESIWQAPCRKTATSKVVLQSCAKAKARALRTRTQLKTVATQSVLYDLGVQAYIAGRYEEARRYFRAFGRDYPSRAVYSAIGLTYMAQALELRRPLIKSGQIKSPLFFYPLILDTNPTALKISQVVSTKKRGESDFQLKKQKKLINKLITKALDYFEKARRLEPEHRNTYLLSAMAQMVRNNTHMARGIVQGELMPRFGRDLETDLLMAMIRAQDGEYDESVELFENLVQKVSSNNSEFLLPKDLITYAIHHNYAAMEIFRGNRESAKDIWQKMAKGTKISGESLLFRLAVNQLNNSRKTETKNTKSAVTINGLKIGDQAQPRRSKIRVSDLWYEGEQLRFYRDNDGSRIVVGSGNRILGSWQEPASAQSIGQIKIGDLADRPLKTYGLPSRSISVVSGEYLAYDELGLALRIESGRVSGWFLYVPPS